MGEWVLYIQPNYAHSKPTHLTPLPVMVEWAWASQIELSL